MDGPKTGMVGALWGGLRSPHGNRLKYKNNDNKKARTLQSLKRQILVFYNYETISVHRYIKTNICMSKHWYATSVHQPTTLMSTCLYIHIHLYVNKHNLYSAMSDISMFSLFLYFTLSSQSCKYLLYTLAIKINIYFSLSHRIFTISSFSTRYYMFYWVKNY